MDITQFLYATFLTVAFLVLIIWASVTLYRYVRSQFRPGEDIVVGNFAAIGQGSADRQGGGRDRTGLETRASAKGGQPRTERIRSHPDAYSDFGTGPSE
jgi:hypothetical protein